MKQWGKIQAVSFKRWPVRLYFTLKINAFITAQCCSATYFHQIIKTTKELRALPCRTLQPEKPVFSRQKERANHMWLAVQGWNPQPLWCQVTQSKLVALFLSPLVMNCYHVLCSPGCSFLIGGVLGTAAMGFIVPILSINNRSKCFCSPSTENHRRHLKILTVTSQTAVWLLTIDYIMGTAQ